MYERRLGRLTVLIEGDKNNPVAILALCGVATSLFAKVTPLRIEKLSFGDDHAGIIQPLEGDEKLTDISKITNK